MDAQQLFEQAPGEWEGTYTLWMKNPDVPEAESATRATVVSEQGGHSLVLRYDWRFGEDEHLAIALLSRTGDGGMEMGWSDTFHAAEGVMHNAAVGNEAQVLGHFGPADAPWGWRTEFEMEHRDQLTIRAFVIKPDGAESLATESVYERVAR